MITMHASLICQVRDGYTGRPLEGSALLCTLDGAAVRPLAKPGGYLILLDLPSGSHRMTLRCRGYQEEWVEFAVDEGTRELVVTMKPGEGYPFRGPVTRLSLTVTEGGTPAEGKRLWLAVPAPWELKVAQTRAEKGQLQLRLYCKGPQSAVSSGAYLLADGENSEIVELQELMEEMGALAAPLLRSHGRGCPLMLAQCYRTGPDGQISAVWQDARILAVYDQERQSLTELNLEPGENRRTVVW